MFNAGKTIFDYLKGATFIGFIALGGFIFVTGLIIAAGFFQFEDFRPNENSGESQLQKQTAAEEAVSRNNSAEGVKEPDDKVWAEKTIAVKPSRINVSQPPPIEPATTLPPKSIEKNNFETTSPTVSTKTDPSPKTTITRPAEAANQINQFETRQNLSTGQSYSREDNNSAQQKIAERQMMNDRRAVRINRTMPQGKTRMNRPFRGAGRRW
jgi:hypothetical protein